MLVGSRPGHVGAAGERKVQHARGDDVPWGAFPVGDVDVRQRRAVLLGRQNECDVFDRLLTAVRAGEGQSLVIRGERGVGKSALLEHLAKRASGFRVVRTAGVQAETGLAFSALHQLCAPLLDLLEELPAPQRHALGTAFGLCAGPAPDRFLIGLAVLGLLAGAAEHRPLLCLIDDGQWLDPASARTLAFVARRLFAESVACVFAVRDGGEAEQLSGLPAMDLVGLRDDHARALLSSVVAGPLDVQVRDRIVAEARGNPRVLLQLPGELTHADLAGGFGEPTARTVPGPIEGGLQRRLERMPAEARQLLLLAAAEPLGDPALLWRAAARLTGGIDGAATAAVDDLIDFVGRVRFRHPSVRSAVYQAASPEDRRRAHVALAEATDAATDPDRRAWHRAHGAAQPDEEVAAELVRSAGRARARGGLAAAAAFLDLAAALTPDARNRTERTLAAAQAKFQAGAPETALALLTSAEAWPLDAFQLAQAERLHAEIALTSNRGHVAPSILLKAASRLEPLDTGLARETYLQALTAAITTLPDGGRGLREVAAAAGAAPPAPASPRVSDLLLVAMSRCLVDGPRTAAPAIRQALAALGGEDVACEEEQRWLWAACTLAVTVWDERACRAVVDRHLRLIRDAGKLALLPLALGMRIMVLLFEGRLDEAVSVKNELHRIGGATGVRTSHGFDVEAGALLALGAWQGRQAEVERLADAVSADAASCGSAGQLVSAHWLRAVLYNGLGQYEEALEAARRACAYQLSPGAGAPGVPVELVEAAARCGDHELAAQALDQLVETTQTGGTDWAFGVEARSRALLSHGEEAEGLYREAIDRLRRTRMRVDLARAHLLYGEWLRRERRRIDAREHLRTAFELFTVMGMEGFARRAQRELLATGETARKRTVETTDKLTPQETHIARLARQGLTNKEIAGRLYISPRTVEYHLRKVYTKLRVTSRNQLDALPDP